MIWKFERIIAFEAVSRAIEQDGWWHIPLVELVPVVSEDDDDELQMLVENRASCFCPIVAFTLSFPGFSALVLNAEKKERITREFNERGGVVVARSEEVMGEGDDSGDIQTLINGLVSVVHKLVTGRDAVSHDYQACYGMLEYATETVVLGEGLNLPFPRCETQKAVAGRPHNRW